MDTREYITSGIIESYALGLTSDQERREVECLSSIYPEIKEEVLNAQRALEGFATSIAIDPPEEMKAKILAAIKVVPQESNLKVVKTNDAIKPVTLTKVKGRDNRSVFAIAASIIVIFGLSVMYFIQLGTSSKLEQQMAGMKKDKTQMDTKMSDLEVQLAENDALNKFVLHSSTQEVVLAGTAINPESKVRIYWNSEVSKAVCVSDYLPTPEAGKQYQLWAISDGVPVDLGMMSKDGSAMMDNIKVQPTSVQAFAITLEKEGGSPTPNLEQLYVIGNTKV